MPGESFENPCVCVPINGGVSPTLQPYVVSVNGLKGILTIAAGGGVAISSVGNSILIAADGSAGLGTVTTVDATSSNSNLVVTGGPVTTVGTFAFSLAGNLNSISGLTMAADRILYTSGAGVFAQWPITLFSRTLISNVDSATWQAGLGISIGGTVQAWSQDLDDFVTNASWSGGDLTLGGGLTLAGSITAFGGSSVETLSVTDSLTVAIDITAGGTVTAATLIGVGTGITGITANNISAGTLAVARGGTNIASYTTGDLIYASGATTLSKLADVAAGAFLRSGGVATAPVWSTTLWPNTLTTGDILYASSATQVSRLADVATTNALISGGIGVAPSWGKITSSHVDNTIPTMSAGINSDITGFVQGVSFQDFVGISGNFVPQGEFWDATGNPAAGNGYILTSQGNLAAWSNQITLDTLSVGVAISIEATITAGGVTGNQTINKAMGSVNIDAGGSSITVTNSLVDANSCVFCQIATNDTTAIIKNVVASSGQFVIRTTAAVTAETRINFLVHLPI